MSAKELNIGDYVRTTDGEIGKIIKCPEVLKENYWNWLWFETTDEQRPIIKENIIKSSTNIIDLIEVGDYVNGVLVEDIFEKEKDKLYIHTFDTEIMLCYTNKNIKSIVTKEQFEAMKYKIGE